MMSYNCFVARALITMEGLRNQGKKTWKEQVTRKANTL
jgi:hypothetical protein